jgi:hypothetical protein
LRGKKDKAPCFFRLARKRSSNRAHQ